MNIKKLRTKNLTKHWYQVLNQVFESRVKNKKLKKAKNNRDYFAS